MTNNGVFPKSQYELFMQISNNSKFQELLRKINPIVPEKRIEEYDWDEHYGSNKESLYNSVEDPRLVSSIRKNKLDDYSGISAYKEITRSVRAINNELIKKAFSKSVIHHESFKGDSEKNNQVFLSYAVKDIFLAIMLFYYFEDRGIYLYIDFLNCDQINDTFKLKKILISQMQNSNQFLLLDGINCKVTIDSNSYIRPWCAWENGSYMSLNANRGNEYNKEIYRTGWGTLNGRSNPVKMIEDMFIVLSVRNGKIIGK